MRVSEFQLAKAAAGDVAAKDPAVQAEKIAVLTSAKANLEELAKELKKKAKKKEPEFLRDAALLTAHKESPGPAPVMIETHPRVDGTRTARAYLATPWDSTGMDGGSVDSLLKRYAEDIEEIAAEIDALKK